QVYRQVRRHPPVVLNPGLDHRVAEVWRENVDAGQCGPGIAEQVITKWLPGQEPIERVLAAGVDGLRKVVPVPPHRTAELEVVRSDDGIETVLQLERLVPPRPRARDRLPAVFTELREGRHAHLRNSPAGRVLTQPLHAKLPYHVGAAGARLQLVLDEPRKAQAKLVQAMRP